MPANPHIESFFDPATFTVSYLVGDPATHDSIVVDPVLDFDPASGTISHGSADAILEAARNGGWRIALVLETHAHADHLSAAQYIRQATGAPVAIGSCIGQVQAMFRNVFNLPDLAIDGSQFNRLLADGETFRVGEMEVEVLHTPGHTPACASYRINDAVFVGDTLFMPDYGTARADFPGGDARKLYRSIRRLLSLPDETRLYLCHDYLPPSGREEYHWETMVAEQRAANIHIRDGIGEEEFVAMREARDKGLAAPRLLLPSVQVNIAAGRLPDPEANGTRYLKIPLRMP